MEHEADELSSRCRAYRRSPPRLRPAVHALRPAQTWALNVLERESSNPFVSSNYTHPLVVDRLRRVHRCANCLSAEVCAAAIAIALLHTAAHGWRTRRHIAHNTTDFSVFDCVELSALLRPLCNAVVCPTLTSLFFAPHDRECVRMRIEDLFFVRYDAVNQRSLGAHRDGSLLSFSIAMNSPREFDGGGTFFAHCIGRGVCAGRSALKLNGEGESAEPCDTVVRPTQIGDLIAHCGKLVHGGKCVTRGVRYILVGFVKACSGAVDGNFLDGMTVDRQRGGGERHSEAGPGALSGHRARGSVEWS
tara:strand:+ start:154 stop:1065 length:912 start_codon:yes stop_codon:yes gene_type:complete